MGPEYGEPGTQMLAFGKPQDREETDSKRAVKIHVTKLSTLGAQEGHPA